MKYIIFVSLLLQGRAAPPVVLVQFLERNPQLHLLRPSELAHEREDIIAARAFSPFVAADVTGDGKPETLAVVVGNRNGNRVYGLVAIADRVTWIVGLDIAPLLGVQVDGTQVRPLYCYACDSNGFLRWNGQEYEWFLYAPGDEISLYHRPPGPPVPPLGLTAPGRVVLRQAPSATARSVARFENCIGSAKILAVGAKEGQYRWYEIEIWYDVEMRDKRGFVRSHDIANGTECVG